MSSTSVTPFTGSSPFAAQLSQVIQTAVARASAPITQLQSEQTTLQGQQGELQTLTADFNSLQSSISSLNGVVASNALSANVSDSSVASAQLASGAMPGTYSLTVVNLGSQANTLSLASLTKVTDPSSQNIDNASSYTLTVEGQSYTITPSGTSLDALVQAINNSGANAQATIVNVGSTSSPDYRLSIQGLDYSPAGITLSDGTNQLLSTITPGSYAQYQVNGEPTTPVSSTSRNVTISPGLTVTLQGTGTTTISVAASTNAIANSLQSFVSAYNNVNSELEKNRGQSGGALAGQSVVYQLQNELGALVNSNTGSGAITSLAQLGFSFDSSGNLQFDSSVLNSANPQQALDFLGSSTTGGFLQSATNLMNSVTDPNTGMLPTATQNISTQLTQLQSQISDDQSKVNTLQQQLTQQMSQADAAISSLEQQVSEMTILFQSMLQDSKNVTG